MALEAPAHLPDADQVAIGGGPENIGSVANRPKQTRVVSSHHSVGQRVADIWNSRELLVYLVRTEIKVKYKNSFLGLLWSMISPALQLVVYTLVFSVFLKNSIPHFVIYLFAGLLLWNFFQTGILTATGVVVNNAGLVKKVSFPREILVLAAIGSAAVFLFFQTCVMVGFMVVLDNPPAWSLLWLVLVALVPVVVFASALGILLAAVNVYMRDTQHLVTVLVGAAWFWACPIVYSYSISVGKRLIGHIWLLKAIYFANPLTPIVMTMERVIYNKGGGAKVNGMTATQAHVLPGWSALHYVWADAAVLGFALALLYVAMVVFGRLAGNFAEEL